MVLRSEGKRRVAAVSWVGAVEGGEGMAEVGVLVDCVARALAVAE